MIDFIVNIIVEHPVIGGSFGAFLAAIIAALLNQTGLAIVLVLVGVGLAVLQIFISSQ